MRTAFLDDAQPEAVSHAVRRVLEERGALVSEHRHSRVRFHGYSPGDYSWERSGYVGIYQHLGEPEVMVRLILRAKWPWRLLWAVALVNVVVALATAAANPPGTTWVLIAILTGFALLAAALVYVGTLRPVREEERALLEAFEAEFAKGLPGARVEDEEEREARRLEAELEGELTRRRLERARPLAAKGGRFSLRPRAKEAPAAADEEGADERRARLLARKAELEARRREGGG